GRDARVASAREAAWVRAVEHRRAIELAVRALEQQGVVVDDDENLERLHGLLANRLHRDPQAGEPLDRVCREHNRHRCCSGHDAATSRTDSTLRWIHNGLLM